MESECWMKIITFLHFLARSDKIWYFCLYCYDSPLTKKLKLRNFFIWNFPSNLPMEFSRPKKSNWFFVMKTEICRSTVQDESSNRKGNKAWERKGWGTTTHQRRRRYNVMELMVRGVCVMNYTTPSFSRVVSAKNAWQHHI